VVKQGHIGDAFFDLDAAQFLLAELQQRQQQLQTRQPASQAQQQQQQQQQAVEPASTSCAEGAAAKAAAPRAAAAAAETAAAASPQQAAVVGSALGHAAGPKWTHSLPSAGLPAHVCVESNARVAGVTDARPGGPGGGAPPCGGLGSGDWRLWVELTDGRVVGADLVVAGIGVEPNTDWLPGGRAGGGGGGGLGGVLGVFGGGHAGGGGGV